MNCLIIFLFGFNASNIHLIIQANAMMSDAQSEAYQYAIIPIANRKLMKLKKIAVIEHS